MLLYNNNNYNNNKRYKRYPPYQAMPEIPIKKSIARYLPYTQLYHHHHHHPMGIMAPSLLLPVYMPAGKPPTRIIVKPTIYEPKIVATTPTPVVANFLPATSLLYNYLRLIGVKSAINLPTTTSSTTTTTTLLPTITANATIHKLNNMFGDFQVASQLKFFNTPFNPMKTKPTTKFDINYYNNNNYNNMPTRFEFPIMPATTTSTTTTSTSTTTPQTPLALPYRMATFTYKHDAEQQETDFVPTWYQQNMQPKKQNNFFTIEDAITPFKALETHTVGFQPYFYETNTEKYQLKPTTGFVPITDNYERFKIETTTAKDFIEAVTEKPKRQRGTTTTTSTTTTTTTSKPTTYKKSFFEDWFSNDEFVETTAPTTRMEITTIMPSKATTKITWPQKRRYKSENSTSTTTTTTTTTFATPLATTIQATVGGIKKARKKYSNLKRKKNIQRNATPTHAIAEIDMEFAEKPHKTNKLTKRIKKLLRVRPTLVSALKFHKKPTNHKMESEKVLSTSLPIIETTTQMPILPTILETSSTTTTTTTTAATTRAQAHKRRRGQLTYYQQQPKREESERDAHLQNHRRHSFKSDSSSTTAQPSFQPKPRKHRQRRPYNSTTTSTSTTIQPILTTRYNQHTITSRNYYTRQQQPASSTSTSTMETAIMKIAQPNFNNTEKSQRIQNMLNNLSLPTSTTISQPHSTEIPPLPIELYFQRLQNTFE